MLKLLLVLFLVVGSYASFDLTLVHTAETFAQITAIDANYDPCQPINGTYLSKVGPCLGGMDRRRGLINSVRSYATNVMLVDAGSMFTHSLFWIVYNSTAMARYYKEMAYDAVSLSIYEFITELEYLSYFSAYVEPETKLVASNLYNVTSNSALQNVTISPYVILQYAGGEKVAFTATTVSGIGPLFRDPGPINSFNELSSMLATVGELQNMGVNKIVASISSKDVFDSIIPYVPGIDVVILPDVYYANDEGGRLTEPVSPSASYPQVLHMPWNQPLLVVGSGSHGMNVGVLNLTFDDNGVIIAYQGNSVQLSDSVPSDASTYVSVQQDYINMVHALGDTIGQASIDILYQGKCVFSECAIGDWAVEVLRSMGKTQIGLFNGGSIYGQLDAGPITLGEVLKIFPFVSNNQVWTLTLDGYSILQALEHSVSLANDTSLGINADIGRFFQVAGVNFTWNPDQPIGKRIVDVWVEEKPEHWNLLDYRKLYNITTLDFTVLGGDEYTVFLENGTNIVNTGFYALIPLEEALYKTLAKRDLPLSTVVDNRILTSNLTRITCLSDPSNLTNVCNGNGYCLRGACVCTHVDASGPFCSLFYSEGSSDQLSIGAVVGIVIGVAISFITLLFLAMLFVLVFFVFRVSRRKENEDWLIAPGEIEIRETLGAGGFGEVHKGVWKGTEVAIKMLHEKSSSSVERRKAFGEEIRVMAKLRHPNVVLFMAACDKPPRMFIVMELMALGSLFDLLHNDLVPSIPYALVTRMMFQAAKGMHFLHSSGVVHGDLKSLNLLLDNKWNVKVSDFGLTKFKDCMKRNRKAEEVVAGSVQWMSPESLSQAGKEEYGCEINIGELTRSDVYSFGVVMWETMTRKVPYFGWTPAQVAVAVIRDEVRPNLGEDLLTEYPEYRGYIELMQDCWHSDPVVRPVFLDIMHCLQTEGNAADSSSESYTRTSSYRPYVHSKNSDTSSSEAIISHHVSVPRENVTFVVCDLAQFNDVWQQDPYEADSIICQYTKEVRTLAFENSGFLFSDAEKHSGGTFMIVFPLPRLAVNFCLSLQSVVKNYARTSRISIHYSRETMFSAGNYDKEAYAEACRINTICPYGCVVASLELLQILSTLSGYKLKTISRSDHVVLFTEVDREETELAVEEFTEEREIGLCSSNACQWIIDGEQVKMDKIIGEGSYGSVSKGTYKGQEVAVKRLIVSGKVGDDALRNMRKEAAILYSLNHPNVVKMLGMVVNERLIVMELVKKGSLRDVLLNTSIKLPWELRISLLREAAIGLQYLHDNSIIHRDVKSSNFLVDEYWNVKVADFGFATMLKEQATITRCGTPAWSAPEVLLNKKCHEKADVYSFAIVMWEVLTRSTPYANKNPYNLGVDVIKGERPQIPSDTDERFASFMQECWSEKAKNRPRMDQVVMFLSSYIEDNV